MSISHNALPDASTLRRSLASLNAKQLDERIRKLEEALPKVLQRLEQEIETIRKNEEIIEAIRLQINLPSPSVKPALSDAPTEDLTPQSDDSPLSASKSDDSQLEAPPTELRKPNPSIEQNGFVITITGKPTPLKMSQGWDSKTLWDAMSPEQQKLHIQHFEKVNEINRLVQDWAQQNKNIEDTTRRMNEAQKDDDRIRFENAIQVAIEQQELIAKEIDHLYEELLDLGVQFGLPDDMARQLADVRLLAQSNNNNIVKYAAEAELNNARRAEFVKRIQDHKYFRHVRQKSLEAMRGLTGVFKSSPEVTDLVLPDIAETLGVVNVTILHILETKLLNHAASAMSAALNFIPYVGNVFSGLNNVKVNADNAQIDMMTTVLDDAQDWLKYATGALLVSRLIGGVCYFKSIVMDGDLSFFWHAISLCVAQISTNLFYSLFGRSLSGYTECLIIGVPLCQTLIQWGCLGAMDCAFEKLGQCVYKDNITGDIKVDVKKVKAIEKTFKSLKDHRDLLKVGIQDANHIKYDKNGSAFALNNGVVLHLKDIGGKDALLEDQVLKAVTLKSFSGQIVTQDAQEFYESGGFLKIFKRAAKDTQITPLQMAPSWRQWLSAKLRTPMSPKSYQWMGLAMALRASLNYGRMLWNWSQDSIAVVVEGEDFINIGGNTSIDLSTIRNSIRQQRMYENNNAGIMNGFKNAVGYSETPPMYKNTGGIVESTEQALEAVAEAFASDKYNSVGVFQYPIVVRNVLTHAEGALDDSSIVQMVNWLPESVTGPGPSAAAGFFRNFSNTVGSFVTWLGPNTKTVFVDQAHIEALRHYSIAMYDGGAPEPDQQLIDSLSSITSKAGATVADVSAAAAEYLSSCGDICSKDVVSRKSNEAIRLLVPKVKQQVFSGISSMCQIIHKEAAQFSQEGVQKLMQTCRDWMGMPGLDEFSDEVKFSSFLRGESKYTYRELAQQCYNVAEGYVNLLGADSTCSEIESKMRLLEQCKNENTPITFTTDRYYGSNVTANEILTRETESVTQKLVAMYDKISLAFVSFATYIGKLEIGEQVVRLFELFRDMLQDGVKSIVSLARLAFGMLGASVSWLPSTKESGEVDSRQDDFEKKVANTTKVCKDVENILKTAGEMPTPWHAQPQDEGGDTPVWHPPMLPPPTNGGSGGLLAIGTGVVADQNLLQRPMRVDYTSAATNLIKVNYEAEECEEEK